MKEGKHVLRWMALLIAIPVGFAGAMVTLAFRHTLDFFNRLLFGRSDDITLAMHAWPWYCWPLIVGGGGDCRYFSAICGQIREKTAH